MFQALAPCQSDWRNCGLCEGLYAENRAMLLVGIWWWENKNKLIEWKALVDTVGNNSADLWGKKVCSTVWQLSIYRFVEVWMLFLTQTYSRSLRVTYGPPEESDMRQEQVTTLANNLRNSGGDVEIGPCGELWWMFIFDKLWEVHGMINLGIEEMRSKVYCQYLSLSVPVLASHMLKGLLHSMSLVHLCAFQYFLKCNLENIGSWLSGTSSKASIYQQPCASPCIKGYSNVNILLLFYY